MAAVNYSPFTVNDAVLMLGADTFPNAINRAECVPAYSSSSYATIDGDDHPIADRATWSLVLDFGQDYTTADSLAVFLAENDGELVPFEYTPQGGGKKLSGTVLCRAATFGGTARQQATASVTLPIKGTPTLTAAA